MSEIKEKYSRGEATAQRKQQVVAAALKCFTDKGVEKTTVADICRESGCSVGSLYHHFGNKEGLAGELFIHAIGLLNQDLLDRLRRVRTVASGVRMVVTCLLYTSPSPRDRQKSRMPSSA